MHDRPLTIDLKSHLIDSLDALAKNRGSSRSDLIREAVQNYDFSSYTPPRNPHQQFSVRLPLALKNTVVRKAKRLRISVGELLRLAILDFQPGNKQIRKRRSAVQASSPLTFDADFEVMEKVDELIRLLNTTRSDVIRRALKACDYSSIEPVSEDSRQVSVRLEPNLQTTLRMSSQRLQLSIGELVRVAVEESSIKGQHQKKKPSQKAPSSKMTKKKSVKLLINRVVAEQIMEYISNDPSSSLVSVVANAIRSANYEELTKRFDCKEITVPLEQELLTDIGALAKKSGVSLDVLIQVILSDFLATNQSSTGRTKRTLINQSSTGRAKRTLITAKLRQGIIDALKAGGKGNAVAAKFGVSVPTLNNIKKAVGLTKARKK
jgi:metal-responsive CopG/Arc/MetJ family transcriptional regulator